MTINNNNLTNRRCHSCGCTWEGSFPCPTCGELSLTAKIETPADVEIKIAGTIIVTDPLTAAGGAVFGAKEHPTIGSFMFWNKPEDPRIALQVVADRHGLKVLWS